MNGRKGGKERAPYFHCVFDPDTGERTPVQGGSRKRKRTGRSGEASASDVVSEESSYDPSPGDELLELVLSPDWYSSGMASDEENSWAPSWA